MLPTRASRRPFLSLVRGYTAAAPKPENEVEEIQAESSSAPHRRASPSSSHPLSVDVSATHSRYVQAPPAAKRQEEPLPKAPKKHKSVPRTIAIMKAKRQANALRGIDHAKKPTPPPAVSPSSNPLSEPELSALLEYKPTEEPYPSYYATYKREYEKVTESINHAFLIGQLRNFSKQLGLPAFKKTSKVVMIRRILDSWGWELPKERERPVKQKGVVQKEFALLPAQLFLFLKDKELVKMLMERHDLVFSVQTPSAETGEGEMSVLVAVGHQQHLQHLELTLNQTAKSMRAIFFSAADVSGLKASPELLRFVSNSTSAYVESLPNDMYRITGMNPKNAQLAKSMLQTAALRNILMPASRPLSTLTPKGSQGNTNRDNCSLYPFLPTCPIPWDVALSSSSSFFRLRSIAHWSAKHAKRESEHRNEHVHEGNIMSLTGDRDEQKFGRLIKANKPEMDLPNLPDGFGEVHESLIATFGHLLYTSDKSSLIPPVKGRLSHDEIRQWVGKLPRPIFTPTVTPAMSHSPLKGSMKRFRRLRYRLEAKPHVRTLTFSYEYPPPAAPSREEPEPSTETQPTSIEAGGWQDELEAVLKKMETEMLEEDQSFKAAAQPVEELSTQPEAEVVDSLSEETAGPIEIRSLEPEVMSFEPQDSSLSPAQHDTEPTESESEPTVSEESIEVPNTSPSYEPEAVNVEIRADYSILSEHDILVPDRYARSLYLSLRIVSLTFTRPIDLRLSQSSTSHLPTSQIPQSIQKFFAHLVSPPLAQVLPTPAQAPSFIRPDFTSASFALESDQEVEIVESDSEDPHVVLRQIKVRDVGLGVDQELVYTEVENRGKAISADFWRELANISRDVGPNASAVTPTISELLFKPKSS
ncbi:hypothetical protein P7C73_g4679, partial [Tremellales sp. Uapishka_1]